MRRHDLSESGHTHVIAIPVGCGIRTAEMRVQHYLSKNFFTFRVVSP